MDLTLDTKSSEWCAQHDKSIMSSDYITLLSKQERKSMSLIKKRGHSEIFSFYCPDWVCSFSMFWRIVNKEVLQSISRPHTKAKIVCTAGNLSDKHKHIWSWTGCIQMVPHLKPRHRMRTVVCKGSKLAPCFEKQDRLICWWLYVEKVSNVCVCRWICLYTRAWAWLVSGMGGVRNSGNLQESHSPFPTLPKAGPHQTYCTNHQTGGTETRR